MGDSCVWTPCTKNSKGEVVDSILWKDINTLLGNDREASLKAYATATDERFLSAYKDDLKFDKNGQVTASSANKIIHFADTGSVLDGLNKKIGAGSYSFKEAAEKSAAFNSQSDFKDNYLATIYRESDGKYALAVVENNRMAQIGLSETIRKASFQQQLIYKLAEKGVGVKFLENETEFNGRYSTENVEKTAENLATLIEIAKGANVDVTLAEEAGHFVVASMQDHQLVDRLISLLTPEVQKKILGDKYEEKVLSTNSAREVAGYLVGKALAKNGETKTFWGKLAERIANFATSLFGQFTKDDITAARREAEKIARQLADDFWSTPGGGTAEEAMQIKETFYDAANSPAYQLYSSTLKKVSTLVENFRRLGVEVGGRLNTIHIAMLTTGIASLQNQQLPKSGACLEAVAIILQDYLEQLREGGDIPTKLDEVQFDSYMDFYSNIPEYARNLRTVHTFLTSLASITKELSIALSDTAYRPFKGISGNIEIEVEDDEGNSQKVNLQGLIDELTKLSGELLLKYEVKSRAFAIRFLEMVHGSSYIAKQTSRGRWGRRNEAENLSIAQIVDHLYTDGSWVSRYLRTAGNSPDIAVTLIDKLVKRTQYDEIQDTNLDQDAIRVLYEEFEKLGLLDKDIYELSETGDYTGNFVSPVNYGLWEERYRKFYREHKEAWIKDCERKGINLNNLSDVTKGVLWSNYIHPLQKQWHKENSKWDKESRRYMPDPNKKSEYKSRQFEQLSKKKGFTEWYEKFGTFYKGVLGRLENGAITPVRAPQFRASFMNRMRNRQNLNINFFSRLTQSTLSGIRATFCESANDVDFGGDHISQETDDIFKTEYDKDVDRIRSLPLFGINKLKNMADLAMDLRYSLLAFCTMANHQRSFGQVMNALEEVKERLTERTLGDSEYRLGKESKIIGRLTDYLDHNMYSISVSKLERDRRRKIIMYKAGQFLKNLASNWFLWGRPKGGITNTGTGAFEILKECAAGEYFTLKDFMVANQMYFESFGKNWAQFGMMSTFYDDKVSLFMRHFDIRDEGARRSRSWRTLAADRASKMFGDAMYMPYSAGDHWMQTIPYLMLANRIYLYGEDGKRVNLWNAYKKVDKEGQTTLTLDQLYFKSADGKKRYDKIRGIVDKLLGDQKLSEEESEFAKSFMEERNEAHTKENTIFLLQQECNSLLWTADDESEYINKAREIDIRLHGVYNSKDAVALQQNVLGSMTLSMRGYILGMMERRFAAAHWNESLGKEVEGSQITYLKYVSTLFTDKEFRKHFASWAGIFCGFGLKRNMLAAGFSEHQVANMRRNWLDWTTSTVLFILGATMFKIGKTYDDDDRYPWEELIGYFIDRWFFEQAAFNTIIQDTFQGILTDLSLPAISVMQEFYDIFDSILAADEDENLDEEEIEEERVKRIKDFIKKHTPYLGDWSLVEDPKKARQGYRYYQKKHRK